MCTITKYILLVLGAFTAAAIAAPAQAAQSSATCVTGVPGGDALFPIDTYAAVLPPAVAVAANSSYDVDRSFVSDHYVGTMGLSISPQSDLNDYASFKCQYSCNSYENCVSFFGHFINVTSTTSSFECLLFDALLDDSSLTLKNYSIPVGGFNALCS